MPPFLQKRLVGLPAWAWLAVVAGGLTIGLILRSRNSASTDEVPLEEDLGDDTAAYGDEYSDPYGEDYAYAGNPSYLLSPSSAQGGDPFSDIDVGDQVYEGAYDAISDAFVDNFPDGIDNSTNSTAPAGVTVNVTKPGGGGKPDKKCGKKPATNPGKGKHWECKGGRWKAVGGQGGGGNGGGGNGGGGNGGGGGQGRGNGAGGGRNNENRKVTAGGPPQRRASHLPPTRTAVAPKLIKQTPGAGKPPKKQVSKPGRR